MNKRDILNSASLSECVANHNQQEDQAWGRTLATNWLGDRKEVIGLCNYGNLYFLQFWTDGEGLLKKADWIRKTDINKKYRDLDLANVEIRDNVLDKFRVKFNEEIARAK
jgi:hypothetical protein